MSKSRDSLTGDLLAACTSNLQRYIILAQVEIAKRQDRQQRDARKAHEELYPSFMRHDGGQDMVTV